MQGAQSKQVAGLSSLNLHFDKTWQIDFNCFGFNFMAIVSIEHELQEFLHLKWKHDEPYQYPLPKRQHKISLNSMQSEEGKRNIFA